jgi:hypothetical protein
MKSNLEKYKSELDTLVENGILLYQALQHECWPEEFESAYKGGFDNKDEYEKFIKTFPRFASGFQKWYSEAHSVIKQLIPDRLIDFVRLYEKPRNRKEITCSSYVIEDYLHGFTVTRGGRVVVPLSSAITLFEQQIEILKSAKGRFESSLFAIKQLVQADLLDSELDAARLLQKNKFYRAAGAIAGVVIEKHLARVCVNHSVPIAKKNPTISDLNDLLKNSSVIEVPQWRFIQHLGDLRNICDHNKTKEPENTEIEDLISGTEKVTKTLF